MSEALGGDLMVEEVTGDEVAVAQKPPPRDLSEFQRRLIRAMAEDGRPAKEIAASAGIKPAYLSDLKRGKRDKNPTPAVMGRLSKALNVTVDWLWFGEGPMRPLPDIIVHDTRVARLFEQFVRGLAKADPDDKPE